MSNYAYAATRVRARRSRLLGPESYNQLLNMEFSEIARYIPVSYTHLTLPTILLV